MPSLPSDLHQRTSRLQRHSSVCFTALSTIYVDAPEGGRIQHVLAQAGDCVSAGQPLIELTNRELELDVLDREGRLIESITQLQAFQTELEQNRVANEKALAQIDNSLVTARRALERRKILLEQNSIAVEAVDQLRDQLEYQAQLRPLQEQSNRRQETLRLQQLPQIRRQLETLQQDVQITHGTLEDLIVRAPVSGRLTAMDLKLGQSLDRGARVAVITPASGSSSRHVSMSITSVACSQGRARTSASEPELAP
jgi:HlyD family secretion protein